MNYRQRCPWYLSPLRHRHRMKGIYIVSMLGGGREDYPGHQMTHHLAEKLVNSLFFLGRRHRFHNVLLELGNPSISDDLIPNLSIYNLLHFHPNYFFRQNPEWSRCIWQPICPTSCTRARARLWRSRDIRDHERKILEAAAGRINTPGILICRACTGQELLF